MRRTIMCLIVLILPVSYAVPEETGSAPIAGIPGDAKFACPMETHPENSEPSKQGPHFSSQAGQCPLCGMELKPLGELPWVQIRRAAEGADVAYTCPDHQHVYSKSAGECPRCGRQLMPFKVMYTCPDSKHAGVINTSPGNCPQCGRGLAAYRGLWLAESMARENVPASPGLAEVAAFRCPVHPLVHSDTPGACTICAVALLNTRSEAPPLAVTIPANARYACPMQECRRFSEGPGDCPVCGMRFKPIGEVAWATAIRARQHPEDRLEYVCPMHREQSKASSPGNCSICGMQLVYAAGFPWPRNASEQIEAQVNYLTEHYLELQLLLASDRTGDVARQALALVAASDELATHIDRSDGAERQQVRSATWRLRAAALQIRGRELAQDRIAFVELSTAMKELIDIVRPSRERWPKLYLYHCPMSKGDWIQSDEGKRNPYYGFKMLTCGELKDIK